MGAAKARCPIKSQAIILVMFWHGLRVTELCRLKTDDLDTETGRLCVRRKNDGLDTNHPVRPDVLRILKRYLRQRGPSLNLLFLNNREQAFDGRMITYLLERASELSTLRFLVTPEMLRHGCGVALANRGLVARLIQDYLGFRNLSEVDNYLSASEKHLLCAKSIAGAR